MEGRCNVGYAIVRLGGMLYLWETFPLFYSLHKQKFLFILLVSVKYIVEIFLESVSKIMLEVLGSIILSIDQFLCRKGVSLD